MMMKNSLLRFMPLALMAAVMSLCVSSCAGDSDDSEILPPEGGDEEVTDSTANVAELDSAEFYCSKGEQKIYGYV